MKRVFYYNITYRCNQDCIFCAADHGRNDTNQEIPLNEFISDLEKNNVGSGDRVIINGGEPTMHHAFLDFLDAVHQRGAYIDLFTNGARLADEAFCKEVCSKQPILIRIPLFGATSAVHDMLTSTNGAFDKVMRAIRNVLNCRNENTCIDLEIKLLMSKATNKENLEIFRCVTRAYPNRDYYFSLNPLLVSGRVKMNSDVMFANYTTSMEEAKALIEEVEQEHWELSLNLIPLCLLDPRHYLPWLKQEAGALLEYYSDPHNAFEFHGEKVSEKCAHCVLNRYCNHFPESYSRYYGDSEVAPFSLADLEKLMSGKCYEKADLK